MSTRGPAPGGPGAGPWRAVPKSEVLSFAGAFAQFGLRRALFRARVAMVVLLVLGSAAGGAAAQPVDYATVPPVVTPGPYPVACSDVEQDFARMRPGESAEAYWQGDPRSDGSARYVTDLLVHPGGGFAQTVEIPDDRDLFGRYRGGSFALAMLVCYPTSPANTRPGYALPDGRIVPRMQRNGESPFLPAEEGRWPLLLFSHGLSGSPLGAGYLDFVTLLATYGYVVAAPFHGDRRFANVELEDLGDVLGAILSFDKFVAMQSLRPVGLVAELDLLLAHPHWQGVVDADRIGGFGASLGAQAMMLLGGARLTTSIGQSSKQVLVEPRLRAAVGYVPYFGQAILPAFGRDQHGVDGVSLAFLAIAGTADVVAPLAQIEDAMVRLSGTRQVVALRGVGHELVPRDVPDTLTWSLAFLDGQVRGHVEARAQFARMHAVAGGSDDATTLDYSAPSLPRAGERIVVEYHNEVLDHYFLTAEPAEAAMLDAGVVVPGWRRTGFEFKAWAADAGNGAPACRFFGTPGRGPSSHFYTNDADECDAVRRNPDWQFEEFAFAATAPQAELCPADRMTVVRLYNDGKGGQANHRYLTSRSATAAMLAQGWFVEGAVFCTLP